MNHILRWRLLLPATLLTLAGLVYLVESRRGNPAGAQGKPGIQARGQSLDWIAQTPPPVPDDQNFFKAPNMEAWFTGRGSTALSSRLSLAGFGGYLHNDPTNFVAKVTVVPANALIEAKDADIVLQYQNQQLTLSSTNPPPPATVKPSMVLPLIVMDEVPLTLVIKNLARQAKVICWFDRSTGFGADGHSNGARPEPTLSVRWENLTGMDALICVLIQYNLEYVPDPQTGGGRITARNSASPSVRAAARAREQLGKMVADAVEATATGPAESRVEAALGFKIVATPLEPVKPVRVTVRSEYSLDSEEVRACFPRAIDFGNPIQMRGVNVESTGSNSFQVRLNSSQYVAAADYLAWSDQFQSDFDAIEAALRRPYARMDGDYEHPAVMPIPNFITIRVTAQALSQRAQCHLLTGEPEKALRELLLIRNLCRLLEGRPTGKPMTLIAAMINVAVTGLYARTLADGLRLGVWREPQLIAIQQQLAQIDLAPFVSDALATQPTREARVLETTTRAQMADLFLATKTAPSAKPVLMPWEKMQIFLLNTFARRSWILQNYAHAAGLRNAMLDGIDATNRLIFPSKVDAASAQREKDFKHLTPFNFITAQMVPNFSAAIAALAKNQTLVNEGYIVCALERHRLARGQYPETLAALVPRFADKLPRDVIGGQPLKYRAENGKFVLYSIGWNEKDDGGAGGLKNENAGDPVKNDWVWPDVW